ncbi:MAG: hypothetical protein C0508_19915, partial [Cyanobacteria bacterium PR.023]|nr:hypothetical protein [Cyanobacteria bacterium PR.023]
MTSQKIRQETVERARTMASNFYLDPAQYDLSLEQIFARSWQFIGTNQTVFGAPAQTGSMAPITLLEGSLNEPLLLTQDNQKLHC